MSDTMNDPTGSMANEARDAGEQIVDENGRTIRRAQQQGQAAAATAGATIDQLGDYVRQQPVSTALLALGMGYIIGRLRIF